MTPDLDAGSLVPDPRDILAAQGVPPGADVSSRVWELTDTSRAILLDTADPRAVTQPVSTEELQELIPRGTPHAMDPVIGWIHPRGDALVLFVATLGQRVSERISELFAQGEYPLAVSLDAAASRMAERITEVLAATVEERVTRETGNGTLRALGYSPGYCGWHVRGQRPLFARLQPETIGVTLGDDCLMHPLKSVSGVIVAATPEVHTFEPGFSFCEECRDRTCIARMNGLNKGRHTS